MWQKPSLLLRKPDLEIKLNLSPKPNSNDRTIKTIINNKSPSSLKKMSNIICGSKEKTTNDELILKNSCINIKKDYSN